MAAKIQQKLLIIEDFWEIDQNVNLDFQSRLGFSAEVFGRFPISEHANVRIGIGATQKGYKSFSTYSYTDHTNNVWIVHYGSTNREESRTAILVPFYLTQHFKSTSNGFYFGLGGNIGLPIYSKTIINGTLDDVPFEEKSSGFKTGKFLGTAQVSIGRLTPLNERISLNLELYGSFSPTFGAWRDNSITADTGLRLGLWF